MFLRCSERGGNQTREIQKLLHERAATRTEAIIDRCDRLQ